MASSEHTISGPDKNALISDADGDAFGSSVRKNVDGHLEPTLGYFLGALDVRIRRASPVPDSNRVGQAALKEINRSLANSSFTYTNWRQQDAAWNEAYRLERLFILVEPPENLWAELNRRLAQAADENVRSAPRLTAKMNTLAPTVVDPDIPGGLISGTDVVVRSLLLDVLEDIHRTIQRKFYSRLIRKSASTRIVCSGTVAFLLFMLPYVILYHSVRNGTSDPIASWAWLPIYTAGTAGLLGALFSRLLYLQSNWNALTIGGLKDAREISSIMLRGCVGMIGAVIAFFILKSGVLGGSLFPTFSDIGIEIFPIPEKKPSGNLTATLNHYYPTKDLALLVVWSFLAGFSERLVPSMLRETETAFGMAPEPK